MNIKSAYFLSSSILHSVSYSDVRNSFSELERDITIEMINFDGLRWGIKGYLSGIQNPPDEWMNYIDKYFIFIKKFDDYIIIEFIIKLHANKLKELIRRSHKNWYEYSKSIDNLYNSFISDLNSKRIEFEYDSFQPQVSNILYIQPNIANPNTDDKKAKLAKFVDDSRAFLEDSTSFVPFSCFDTIFFCGLGLSEITVDLTLISLRQMQMPKDQSENTYYIPITVLDMQDYFSYMRILKHLCHRTKKLKLNYFSLSEYINRFKDSTNFLNNYENTFLIDSHKLIDEKPKIINTTNNISKKLEDNRFYFASMKNSIIDFDDAISSKAGYFYTQSLSKKLINIYSDYKTNLEELLQNLSMRHKIFSEHLRDVITIQNNSVNLRLQRSVKILTIVTIIITLIALFISILPENTKANVYNKLINLLF